MQNYLIIGASSGVGKALSQVLEQENASIYATYNNNAQENTSKTKFYKFNVLTDEFDTSILPEEIHGLVYCPGSINLKSFHRFKEEELLEDYKLQVIGATKVIKQVLPKLKNATHSSIVLFSTIAVQNGFNFHSQVAMSKGAIEGLTRALAAEFAPTIRVNAIAPSLIDTPLAGRLLSTPEKVTAQAEKNPLKRVGNAADIAEMAAFLLSKKSSWITGQILHIDGGFSSLKV